MILVHVSHKCPHVLFSFTIFFIFMGIETDHMSCNVLEGQWSENVSAYLGQVYRKVETLHRDTRGEKEEQS